VSDSGFLNSICLSIARGATRAFRNSVGLGWVGQSKRFSAKETITVAPGDVLIRRARPLHAGLVRGSGDLIGWHSVVITPEMVGRRVAVFVSLEGKQGSDRSSPEQIHWREQVAGAGGIAAEVRRPEDARDAIAAWESGSDLPFVGKFGGKS
jgi:hypothetical protein